MTLELDEAKFSAAEFQKYLKSFLIRVGDIDWLEWLPIALIASQMPDRWVTVFAQFDSEDQFELLNLLRAPAAGPFADALLIVLAEHASEFKSNQVRLFLLEDVTIAFERDLERISLVQERVSALASLSSTMRERIGKSFDTGAEILRLEREVADIRLKEAENGERFSKIHELELEVSRIQMQKRVLDQYDLGARQRFLAQLRTEVQAGLDNKHSVELEIGRTTGERDQAQKTTEVRQVELESVRADLRRLHGLRDDVQNDIDSLRQEAQALENRNQAARQECLGLRGRIAALMAEGTRLDEEKNAVEQEHRELQAARDQFHRDLEGRRAQLRDLRNSAEGANAAEIVRRIDELIHLLPNDGLDQGFRSN